MSLSLRGVLKHPEHPPPPGYATGSSHTTNGEGYWNHTACWQLGGGGGQVLKLQPNSQLRAQELEFYLLLQQLCMHQVIDLYRKIANSGQTMAWLVRGLQLVDIWKSLLKSIFTSYSTLVCTVINSLTTKVSQSMVPVVSIQYYEVCHSQLMYCLQPCSQQLPSDRGNSITMSGKNTLYLLIQVTSQAINSFLNFLFYRTNCLQKSILYRRILIYQQVHVQN